MGFLEQGIVKVLRKQNLKVCIDKETIHRSLDGKFIKNYFGLISLNVAEIAFLSVQFHSMQIPY